MTEEAGVEVVELEHWGTQCFIHGAVEAKKTEGQSTRVFSKSGNVIKRSVN